MHSGFSLTHGEAVDLKEQYSHLIGHPLHRNSTVVVSDVVVAPAKRTLQWFFVEALHTYQDTRKALSLYRGAEFDVILIACSRKSHPYFEFKDLRSYLQANPHLQAPALQLC